MSKAPTARLDRLLANMAYGSRREIQQMMDAGWIDGWRSSSLLEVELTYKWRIFFVAVGT